MTLSLDRIIAEIPVEEAFGVVNRLASQVDAGFSRDDAARLFASITSLTGEEDRVLVEPWVEFRGTRVPLVIYATKAAEGVEFLFMSAGPLSAVVEKAVKECGGAKNIRVLKAIGEA